MNNHRVLLVCALLAVFAATGAFGADFNLELGGLVYGFNSLSASTGSPYTTQANFSLDPYLNGSYALKLGDVGKLKLGAAADGLMGTTPGFLVVGKGEPFAEITAGGLTARASFPLFVFHPDASDPSSRMISYMFNQAYKAVALSTKLSATNVFLATTLESISFRAPVSKSLAFSAGAIFHFGIYPSPWLYTIKPVASIFWGPIQLDLMESIYFVDTTYSFTDSAYSTQFFTDPKLTFNFTDLGLKGFKMFLAASLSTAKVTTAQTTLYGTFKGSSITPGLAWSVGGVSMEASFKVCNFDKTLSADGANPTFDPYVKLSYSFAF